MLERKLKGFKTRVLFTKLGAYCPKKYVFHGSPTWETLLVPQHPTASVKNPALKRKRVYASRSIILAIIYATLDNPSWRIDTAKRRVVLRMPPKIGLRRGFVHVLPEKGFSRTIFVTSSREKARPVAIYEVNWHTLDNLVAAGYVVFDPPQ